MYKFLHLIAHIHTQVALQLRGDVSHASDLLLQADAAGGLTLYVALELMLLATCPCVLPTTSSTYLKHTHEEAHA
jgi:hypothetical protein